MGCHGGNEEKRRDHSLVRHVGGGIGAETQYQKKESWRRRGGLNYFARPSN